MISMVSRHVHDHFRACVVASAITVGPPLWLLENIASEILEIGPAPGGVDSNGPNATCYLLQKKYFLEKIASCVSRIGAECMFATCYNSIPETVAMVQTFDDLTSPDLTSPDLTSPDLT